MKFLRFILGIISSFSLMFIALVTSIEIAAYSDFSFYEKEYKKYAVTTFVDISIPDLMDVTVDMMHYLNGTKDTLTDVKATIKDVPDTPFFNAYEGCKKSFCWCKPYKKHTDCRNYTVYHI